MARKASSGGKVTEIGPKLWVVEASGGTDPITGKRIRARERFHGNKTQAEERLQALKNELKLSRELSAVGVTERDLLDCGLSIGYLVQDGTMNAAMVKSKVDAHHAERERLLAEEKRRMPFCDFFEEYLAGREKMEHGRKSTMEKYRSVGSHIQQYLEGKELVDVDTETIERMYGDFRAAGMGDETLLVCHTLMNMVMAQAYKFDRIDQNPMDKVERPKRTTDTKRGMLQPDEVRRLDRIITTGELSAYKMAVYIALATGARLGEILGLQWEHVREDHGRPYIDFVQQHTRYNERTDLKTDKHNTRKGRIVPIDRTTLQVLGTWKATQRAALNELGIEQGKTTPIITNTVGNWVTHSDLERWFREFCARNGFGAFYTEDGRQIVELLPGDSMAMLYPEDQYLVLWRDADGWQTDENGKRFSRSNPNPYKGLKRHYEGLRFHWLRHSHFSLRRAGVASNGTIKRLDPETLQQLGGWKDNRMIDRIYGHPVEANLWASAGFMDSISGDSTHVERTV
ncbi:MAG: tyrosine-type recombinase/integrase [Coriobacteriales bacterium]|nr:tyrosine-type recombinase/integrase [Coriobacteriales bacterium]